MTDAEHRSHDSTSAVDDDPANSPPHSGISRTHAPVDGDWQLERDGIRLTVLRHSSEMANVAIDVPGKGGQGMFLTPADRRAMAEALLHGLPVYREAAPDDRSSVRPFGVGPSPYERQLAVEQAAQQEMAIRDGDTWLIDGGLSGAINVTDDQLVDIARRRADAKLRDGPPPVRPVAPYRTACTHPSGSARMGGGVWCDACGELVA